VCEQGKSQFIELVMALHGCTPNRIGERMKLFVELRQRARHVVGPIIGSALVVYIAYNTLQGDRGLIAYWQLTKQVEQARAAEDVVDAQRRQLENRVKLLNPGSLDADMLEERARFMLGYSRADEYVIILR
jgi:cell division protein FtsB